MEAKLKGHDQIPEVYQERIKLRIEGRDSGRHWPLEAPTRRSEVADETVFFSIQNILSQGAPDIPFIRDYETYATMALAGDDYVHRLSEIPA